VGMGVVLWWWGFGVGWVRLRYGVKGGGGDGGLEFPREGWRWRS